MDTLPSSTKTLSSHSSSESIADSVLRTPLDIEHPSPPNSCIPTKNALNMASHRIEILSKRSNTLPAHLRPQSHSTHPIIRPQNLRPRPRTDSTASIASTSSQVSLLRATLKMVTVPRSSQSEAGTYGSTPSLLTSRTSISSFASTSPSNPISIPPCVKNAVPPLVLAAEATTALSPSTGTSLAQFSPTPRASSSLLRFGVSNARSKSVTSETRRSLGRVCSGGGDDSDRFIAQGVNTRHDSLWFTKPQDLPSISRALEPDEAIHPTRSPMSHGPRSTLSIPTPQGSRVITPGQPLLGTPRPDDGIKLRTEACSDQHPITITSKGKGKERAAPPEIPACSRLSSRITTPVEPKGNLPTLEAIESGSRLMRSKIVCSTCGEVGPDLPRCGRCSEAWCSRECRLYANTKTGGKHRCASSIA